MESDRRVMKRKRLLQTFVFVLSIGLVADCAMALAGPLEFSFATGFRNNVFLLPFRLGGCG